MLTTQAIGTEMEIEMSKILHAFIVANAHYFSQPILEAVNHLMFEVEKLEASQSLESIS